MTAAWIVYPPLSLPATSVWWQISTCYNAAVHWNTALLSHTTDNSAKLLATANILSSTNEQGAVPAHNVLSHSALNVALSVAHFIHIFLHVYLQYQECLKLYKHGTLAVFAGAVCLGQVEKHGADVQRVIGEPWSAGSQVAVKSNLGQDRG